MNNRKNTSVTQEREESVVTKSGKEENITSNTYQKKARVKKYLARRALGSPTKVTEDAEGNIELSDDFTMWAVSLFEATGSVDEEYANKLISKVGNTFFGNQDNNTSNLNNIMVALHGIGPQDELEGMLAAQMIATHNMAMECLKRTMLENQHPDAIRSYSSLGNKFLRTFVTQMDALNKHRGKSQQNVVVKHVHVSEGGQAIVGNVQTGGQENKG